MSFFCWTHAREIHPMSCAYVESEVLGKHLDIYLIEQTEKAKAAHSPVTDVDIGQLHTRLNQALDLVTHTRNLSNTR